MPGPGMRRVTGRWCRATLHFGARRACYLRSNFRSARTRSATDCARIFSITCARWAFTVRSAMSSWAAICLLSLPATTPSKTSRSRVVSALVARLQLVLLLLAGHGGGLVRKGRFHGREQQLALDGLGEEIDGARAHRAHAHRDVAVAGEEDDRDRVSQPRERVLHLEAADARHPDVEDQAAGSGRRPARGGSSPRDAWVPDLVAERASAGGPARCARPRRRPARGRCPRGLASAVMRPPAGSETRRPPPSGLSAQIRPPCASMIVRAIDRPRPMPFALVVKKESNRRETSASGMPGPESFTETSTMASASTVLDLDDAPGRAALPPSRRWH